MSINKPFKGWLKESWRLYIQKEARRVNDARKAGDLAAKIKAPSKQDVVDWVVAAVSELRGRQDLVRKSFVVTGIATSLNGAEDHLVRKEQDAGSDSDESFEGFGPEDFDNEGAEGDKDISFSDLSDSEDEDM